MRGIATLVSALAFLLVGAAPETAAAWQEPTGGTSVETEDGELEIGAWIEVDLIDEETPVDDSDGDPNAPDSSCYFRRGDLVELMSWLESTYLPVPAPDPDKVFIFKVCKIGVRYQLVTFWVYLTSPRPGPIPPSLVETTRLRNEAWSRLAIPEPTTQTAPREIAIVHLPIYVWVSASDRTPVSETVATMLDGHELSLTATASPRRLGFLRIDMGDGNTLWCDADDVVAFNHSRDPFDQPSNCFHYYRQSSVSQPNLRYQVALTAHWKISVACVFNGRPCTNPPPAVPTQALTAPLHPVAVAEIQALARPG